MSTLQSPTARVTADAMHTIGERPGQHYIALLDAAFSEIPPQFEEPWFGNLFRHRGRDPTWVASLLASDSYMEGYSAKRLWQYAAQLGDEKLAHRMRRHAADEARHSKIFGAAILKTFPELASGDLRTDLDRNAPSLTTGQAYLEDGWRPDAEEVLTSLILINLFEIKALVVGMMLKPLVLAHAPEHNRRSLRKMLDLIIRDEASHISYSAAFLEVACVSGQREQIGSALRDFQNTLNQVMRSELDADSSRESGQMQLLASA